MEGGAENEGGKREEGRLRDEVGGRSGGDGGGHRGDVGGGGGRGGGTGVGETMSKRRRALVWPTVGLLRVSCFFPRPMRFHSFLEKEKKEGERKREMA